MSEIATPHSLGGDKIEIKVKIETGGPVESKLNEDPKEDVSQHAALEDFKDGLGSLQLSEPKESVQTGQEIKPGQGPLKSLLIEPVEIINDRDLRTPIVLIAGDRRDIRPTMGKYVISGKFLRPATVNKWVILVLFDKELAATLKGVYEVMASFAEEYVKIGRLRGVHIPPIASIEYVPSQPTITRNVETISSDALKEELSNLVMNLNGYHVDHALVILPDNCPAWIHSYVQYLETCPWIHKGDKNTRRVTITSRMRYETLVSLGHNVIPSLWLKYNTKLGGLNIALKSTFDTHEMKFLRQFQLLIAIDLYQPPSDEETKIKWPQIAVAVGMWDLSSANMSFHTQTKLQNNDYHDVEDIDIMIGEILKSYKSRKYSMTPHNVIVFRSGVYLKADDVAVTKEISKIKRVITDACSTKPDNMPARLTYLKVPKSSKMRKYEKGTNKITEKPEEPSKMTSQKSEVQSGSLVDSLISGGALAPTPTTVRPSRRDLGPNHRPRAPRGRHPPRPKENRPSLDIERSNANVFKIYDEGNLSRSDIQSMIYAVSYLSPRTTSRTRPTPIDLADLAGVRTQNIVSGWLFEHKVELNEKSIKIINNYLTNEMGDAHYKNYLYYI